MKERSLHSLFGRLVILAVPLATQTGCGGAAHLDDEGGRRQSGGSGGAGTGGWVGIAGSGTAGSATGGSPTGGSSTGGSATGGGGTGGSATGGSATGGGGTGGSVGCFIPYSLSSCTARRSAPIPSSCASAPITAAECLAICGTTFGGICENLGQTVGTVTISCPPSCVAGRRPHGFVDGQNAGSGLGAYFARAAELEGASVIAFRGLRAELRTLGAPRRLLRALSRAARDEQRHTRTTSALARRFGARSVPARVAPSAERSLEAIALENVAEGCVRELYGALVATFQASTARDLQVKAAMARIAREETRHAALSLSLQRWLEQRLDRHALARVATARRDALQQLRREIDANPELSCAEQAGLPTVLQAQRLFDSLSDVWLDGSAAEQLA